MRGFRERFPQERHPVTPDHRPAAFAWPLLLASAACLAGCGGEEPRADVQEQIALLQSSVDEDRYQALAHLQTLGPDGREAAGDLKKLLKAMKDDDMAAEIAKTLGSMGPAGAVAVPELTALLGRKAMWPRYAAVDALGRMGPAAKSALPAVLKLTRDPDQDVAAAARESARRLQRSAKTR
jgi:hypothetical protein